MFITLPESWVALTIVLLLMGGNGADPSQPVQRGVAELVDAALTPSMHDVSGVASLVLMQFIYVIMYSHQLVCGYI